jgi:hypothetical protein
VLEVEVEQFLALVVLVWVVLAQMAQVARLQLEQLTLEAVVVGTTVETLVKAVGLAVQA